MMSSVYRRTLPALVLAAAWLALAASAGAASGGKAARGQVADPSRPTVLVTGSNRGIGLAFVRHYAGEGWNVIATARSPKKATELNQFAAANPGVIVEKLDVTDVPGIEALAAKYRGTPVDVLINNAAVLGDLDKQKVGGLDHAQFRQVMDVNVFGPLKVSEAFTGHVAASGEKKIIALTSGLGSITLMGNMSGLYYYRLSKSALNMGMRGLRADLRKRGIIVALITPGMVGTQLLEESGWTGDSLTPDESVSAMAEIIAGLDKSYRGEMINYDRKVIPW